MPAARIHSRFEHPKRHVDIVALRARGSTLVSTMVALVAAAALVGAIYITATSSSRTAVGQGRIATLEAFALGVLNICPDLVDRFMGTGAYSEGTLPPLVTTGGFSVTLVDLNAAAEVTSSGNLAPTEPWILDYTGGTWTPDYSISDGRYTAMLDIDRLRNLVNSPDCKPDSMNVQEFPSYNASLGPRQDCALGAVRCLVVATENPADPMARQTVVYAYDRKFN